MVLGRGARCRIEDEKSVKHIDSGEKEGKVIGLGADGSFEDTGACRESG